MDFLARLAASILALVLTWATLAKILNFGRWREALHAYRLPRWFESLALVGVPAAEASIAALLLYSPCIGAGSTLVMLGGFSLAIVRARSFAGDRLPCGCFGSVKERSARLLMTRNLALAAVAAIVLIGCTARPVEPGPGSIPVLLVLAGVPFGTWVIAEVVSALRGRQRS